VASLVEGSSLLGDKALLVDGAVVDETVGQTSAENSLARALGAPTAVTSGRQMRTMIRQRRRPNFGPDLTMEALDITGGVTKIGGRWQR